MDALVSQLFAGLSLGSVLLLAALGLALTFGQMGVINMAHGEFMMAGAYTAFVVQGVIADAESPCWSRSSSGSSSAACSGCCSRSRSSRGCTSGRWTRCW